MNKEALRLMLQKQTERYQNVYGGEVTRYAEKDPRPKPLIDRFAGMRKPEREDQKEWGTYIAELEAGTYEPHKREERDIWWKERRELQMLTWSAELDLLRDKN